VAESATTGDVYLQGEAAVAGASDSLVVGSAFHFRHPASLRFDTLEAESFLKFHRNGLRIYGSSLSRSPLPEQ